MSDGSAIVIDLASECIVFEREEDLARERMRFSISS